MIFSILMRSRWFEINFFINSEGALCIDLLIWGGEGGGTPILKGREATSRMTSISEKWTFEFFFVMSEIQNGILKI